MGLDIYLTPWAEAQADRQHNDEWDAKWAAKERGEITQEEFDAWIKANPIVLDRGEKVASKLWPEHLCTPRYLRSSYNDSGFNRAVPEFLVGTDFEGEGSFYWIFEPMGREWDGDSGELDRRDLPRLVQCLERARAVAQALRALSSGKNGPLRTISVAPVVPPTLDAQGALVWAQEALERAASTQGLSGGWSSRDGFFAGPEGMTIVAAVHGRDVLGRECVYLVYRADEQVEWYAQTADIAAEFIEEAAYLIARDGKVEMVWSG